jgi:hypothetical protein
MSANGLQSYGLGKGQLPPNSINSTKGDVSLHIGYTTNFCIIPILCSLGTLRSVCSTLSSVLTWVVVVHCVQLEMMVRFFTHN